MSNAILLLRLEHGNVARLLDLLEDQADRLRHEAPVDYEILSLACEYLSGYPNECHHPKEDLIFNLLRERDPAAAAGLADLLAEHQQLTEQTERLGDSIRGVGTGAGLDGQSLSMKLQAFIELQRQHMAREELEFFPIVLRSLSRDDMAELDFRLFDMKDHLFDEEKESRFERLRAGIRAATADRLRTHSHGTTRPSRDEVALLDSVTNVEQFNRAFADRGLRVVAYRSGGYALERDGHWILDIPECEEGRAVWCAYFFIRGQATH